MASTQQPVQRRGPSLSAVLWSLVAILIVLQLALPAGREALRWTTLVARGALRTDRAYGQSEDAWMQTAVVGLKPSIRPDGSDWRGWFARGYADWNNQAAWREAYALTPDRETVALAWAEQGWRPALSYETWQPGLNRPSLEAARRATEAAPDNALSWYLLAAAQWNTYDYHKVLATIARGNRAARYDDRVRPMVAALVAARDWPAGAPQDLAWLNESASLHAAHAVAIRSMVRELTDRNILAERRELVVMGNRMFEDSQLAVGSLVGLACQSIAAWGPRPYPHPQGGTKPTKGETSALQLRSFARELRTAGNPAGAQWAEAAAKRVEAFRPHALDVIGPAAADRAERKAFVATLVALGCWLAALLCLFAATYPRWWRDGRVASPWSTRSLLRAWAVWVLPLSLVAMLVGLWRLGGVDTQAADPLAGSLRPFLIATLVPVAACAAVLLRRPPAQALGLVLPTAALLLLIGFGAELRTWQLRHQAAAAWQDYDFNKAADLRGSGLDAAGPRPVVDWKAPPWR